MTCIFKTIILSLPLSIKWRDLFSIAGVNLFTLFKYFAITMFGTKFNIFCSPQPWGILNNLSKLFTVGPSKSPIKKKKIHYQNKTIIKFILQITTTKIQFLLHIHLRFLQQATAPHPHTRFLKFKKWNFKIYSTNPEKIHINKGSTLAAIANKDNLISYQTVNPK